MKLNELNEFLFDKLHLVNYSLGAIKNYKLFYTASIEPDYDYSNGYDGYAEKNYYFKDRWSFDYEFFKLFSVSVESMFFVTPEIKNKIFSVCPKTKIILADIKSFTVHEYINSYFENNPDKKDLSDFGGCVFYMDKSSPPYISTMKVDSINNNLKEINYSGSFYSAGIDHGNTLDIICELDIIATKKGQDFHLELLIEAYALLEESNFKMSYFMSYAALENYINEKINGQSIEGRFQDKFKKAYDTVPNLCSSETYSKLKNMLGHYTFVRNIIAHGKDNDSDKINETSAKEVYIFVVAVILSIEKELKKISDIKNHIKTLQKK